MNIAPRGRWLREERGPPRAREGHDGGTPGGFPTDAGCGGQAWRGDTPTWRAHRGLCDRRGMGPTPKTPGPGPARIHLVGAVWGAGGGIRAFPAVAE
ncbi:MAG: hypothetical protein ACO2PN_28015 [Pyrobaculum sp.]